MEVKGKLFVCTQYSLPSYWNKTIWWSQDIRSRSEMEVKAKITIQRSNHCFIV